MKLKDRATILILGQSNAGNHGPVRADAGPNASVFFEGLLVPARDPLPGASGNGGSVWTRFCPKAIAAGLCSEMVFINISQGGTTMADWAPGGGQHARLAEALRKAADAGLEITHVVWHQGERDTLLGTNEASYTARLSDLIRYLRGAAINAPVFVCQASYRDGQMSADVRSAQRNIANPNHGIFAGPDTDTMGADMRYDNTHLTAEGQDRFADMLVAAFADEKGQREDTPPAPQ